jgi:hypothetical protein
VLLTLSQPDEADCQAVPPHIYLYRRLSQMEEKTHHIVYETTNLINGKKYIGKHTTKNLDDGYLGSGILLRKDIKRYGKENFERIILAEFDTEEDAYKYESKLVTLKESKDTSYYNSIPGGCGISSEMWKDQKYREMKTRGIKLLWEDDEFRNMMSISLIERWKNEEFRKKMSDMQKNEDFLKMQKEKGIQQWKDPKMREILHKAIIDRCSTPEYKEKMKKTLKNLWKTPEYREKMCKKRRGENNSAAKLTERDVIEIKKELKTGIRGTGVKLSRKYNISPSTISSINVGRLWKNIKIENK